MNINEMTLPDVFENPICRIRQLLIDQSGQEEQRFLYLDWSIRCCSIPRVNFPNISISVEKRMALLYAMIFFRFFVLTNKNAAIFIQFAPRA